MIHAAFILLASLGQVPFYGDIPDSVPTYKMTYPDGAVAYGALWVDGKWYAEDTVTLPPGKMPTIMFDTPWAPGQDRPVRQPDYSLETISLRKQRLTQGWKEAGYAPVKTAKGELYAPKDEIKLAERAREMEAAVAAEMTTSSTTTAEVVSTPPAPVMQSPVERWGMQAAIGIAGLVVTVLIFRRMVLDAG